MSENINLSSFSTMPTDPAQLAALDAYLERSRIRASHRYDVPQEILWVNGACIATLGNFSVTTGKAKSRKTFNVSALVAAALCNGQVLGYRAKMPVNRRAVLYVDTEQSDFHCHNVVNRILTLAGMPANADCENLIFEGLRDSLPELRKVLVERAIQRDKDKIGLVIIDGIRDLMIDINDSGQSITLANDLMRWSAAYNIHIHVAIHLNKSDDNVRGHIGTEINNKAETVLLVSKDSYDDNISKVSPLYMRDKEFKEFHFQIDEEGLPETVFGYKHPEKEKKQTFSFSNLTEKQHTQALDAAFKHGILIGRNKTTEALKEAYAAVGFDRGPTTFGKILGHLIKKGTVIQQNKHHYCLSRDYPSLPIDNPPTQTDKSEKNAQ